MRWTLKEIPEKEKIIQLAKDLSVDKVIAKILIQRGISSFNEAKKFFRQDPTRRPLASSK